MSTQLQDDMATVATVAFVVVAAITLIVAAYFAGTWTA